MRRGCTFRPQCAWGGERTWLLDSGLEVVWRCKVGSLYVTGQRMRVTSRQPKELALGTVGLGGNEASLYSKKDERAA